MAYLMSLPLLSQSIDLYPRQLCVLSSNLIQPAKYTLECIHTGFINWLFGPPLSCLKSVIQYNNSEAFFSNAE